MFRETMSDQGVRAAYDRLSPAQRKLALRFRELVFITAANTPGTGKIEETLRWQQPSYITAETGSGSTIRIDGVKGSQSAVAIFFHCQSGLVANFRDLYGEKFTYGGLRCLVFEKDKEVDETALRHCLALALTHHSRKRKRG